MTEKSPTPESFSYIQHSIATKLLRNVFAFYVIVALIVTGVHLYIEYHNTKSIIVNNLKIVYDSNSSNLATSLWAFAEDQTQATIKGLVKIPDVVGVKLQGEKDTIYASGTILDENNNIKVVTKDKENIVSQSAGLFFYESDLYSADKSKLLGKLTLYSSYDIVHQRVIMAFSLLIINATIKTIALWVIFLSVANKLLSFPLRSFMSAAKQVHLDNLEYVEFKVSSKGRNELNLLAEAFNEMVRKLLAARQELQIFNQQLEQKVLDRTQELQERYTEIAALNTNLVQLNQEKNEFLGIVVHDLKNPLSAIDGAMNLVRMDLEVLPKSPQVQEILEIISLVERSSKQMFELVTNLLDVSAIEAGKMNVNWLPIKLAPIVQDLLEDYKNRIDNKSLQVVWQCDDVEMMIVADANLVRQVFENIVSNAVKYSPLNKSVYIRLVAHQNQVRFEVQDEGAGLSQQDQKKLFGKFSRLTPRPTGSEHSTGLGLFIVRKLVEAMNGQVWCESELGKGSIFFVAFPACRN